jgi:cobalt/nickel transport system permease protein
MVCKDDILADAFAQRDNPVTGIDARTKIAFTVGALITNLLSMSIFTPIAIATLCLTTLIVIRIPPRLLTLRLVIPMLMAVVVLITQIFLHGTTPLFTVSFWGFNIAGYEEGLARGLSIICRVIGGVSLILFLGMTTPANKLLLAASWFRIPKIFIELSLLVYRYIFVLIEEALAIREAQKVRLGYHNWHQSMQSVAIMASSLIFRAFDRAERVFESMVARGYTGSMAFGYTEHFDRKDFITATVLGMLLAIFYVTGQLSL